MIQLRIKSKHEDRFGVALRDYKNRSPYIDFKSIDVDSQFVDFKIDCHPKFINNLFNFFKDLEEIFDIDYVFRFVYKEKDLYTGFDSFNSCSLKWLNINNENTTWE